MDWKIRCEQLQQRVEELEAENRELRSRLGLVDKGDTVFDLQEVKTAASVDTAPSINKYTPPDEKIRLFRSLFRGREDVFAKRWHSIRSGKSGYAPVCANEWKENVCIRPKGTCTQCSQRILVPLSDQAIYGHLSGKDTYGRDVVGLYPIGDDDTCFFLAIDFDDGDWKDNTAAVRKICEEWTVPCAVERSRSGEGAHVWIFFSEPITCAAARKLGSLLLTATMERDGKLKLDSYDRMFPCQDTLPNGGFGNLIALPLQGQARKNGNSLFVDEFFSPYPDQWAYLAQIRRLSVPDVENLLRSHSQDNVLGELYEA